jgi:hypothetical protein
MKWIMFEKAIKLPSGNLHRASHLLEDFPYDQLDQSSTNFFHSVSNSGKI